LKQVKFQNDFFFRRALSIFLYVKWLDFARKSQSSPGAASRHTPNLNGSLSSLSVNRDSNYSFETGRGSRVVSWIPNRSGHLLS